LSLLSQIAPGKTFKLGTVIKKTGIEDSQSVLPLFKEEALFPAIRQATIHQVKGQTVDAALVIASKKFWDSVVKMAVDNKPDEDRRLAYVAMTRARHTLMVALPADHFDKHQQQWANWGFEILS